MIIPKHDLIKRFGKRGFVKFAVNHRNTREMTGAERAHSRRWGKNVKAKMCEHGVWVIDNYKTKKCELCFPETRTKPRDFVPYFNLGLGAYVESRSDEKKCAKRMNLEETG